MSVYVLPDDHVLLAVGCPAVQVSQRQVSSSEAAQICLPFVHIPVIFLHQVVEVVFRRGCGPGTSN